MKRYALVIGIGDYDSPNLGNLSKPGNDARAIAELLKAHGNFQDVMLLNGTRAKPGWVDYDKLDKELGKFLKQAANQDALIYFTGHGFTVEESEFDQRGYLATSTCKVKLKNTRIISQEEGLSFNKLNGLIQKANLSSLLMLLDCCHSGFLIEDDLVKQSLLAFSKNNYCLIAACRSFQESYALKSQDHSVFTGTLLESLLEKHAQQGEVTALDAFGFIDRQLKNSGQEPIFLGMGGAIPIVRYAVAAEVTPDETCPYQGLEAFTEATAQFFFGRDRDVEKLWQALDQRNFVAVIGASGSGKSSLVRAGLIPALKQSGTNWVVLEPMKPGLKPLQSLEETLEPLFQGIENQRLLDSCINEDESQGLLPLVQALPLDQRVLLVVDQFEELFTVSKPAQSRRLINLLCQLAETPKARLAVVMTMRADFVEACLQYEALKRLLELAVYVSPLTGSDLVSAIAKPAEKQGYRLTAELLSEMIKDAQAEPGFLPLLQFALTQLWELRDNQSHQLAIAGYQTIGRLAGALNDHADQIYHYQDYIDSYTGAINLAPKQERPQIEQDWIRGILLRLVRSSEGEKDTRQRQLRVGLLELAGNTPAVQQPMERVLESLIKGRLLVSEQGSIDLAHEALILGWQRLATWCEESRKLRRLSQRLEAARLEWERDQQNPNLTPEEKNRNLMMGGLLAEVREKWQDLLPYLQDRGKDEPFWQRSDAYEQDQIARLEQALTESRLRELAAQANYLVLVKARTGMELALQAMGENLEQFPNRLLGTVQGSLHQALELARLPNIIQGHQGSVLSVVFSPDGKTIVSGSSDSTIRLWSLDGSLIRQPIQGHQGSVLSVAFSPDGETIVSGSSDSTIRLWSLDGTPVGEPIQGHQGSVRAVAFSPDGKTIVSGSSDSTIRLWSLDGSSIGEPLQGHQSWVLSVAFSPDGKMIVSSGSDSTIRLWRLDDTPVGELLQRHQPYVRSVAFSPDGRTIVSGSSDKTIRLWRLDGTPIGEPMQGHQDGVFSVAFSPDGQTIVSGSFDQTIRLWSLDGKLIGEPLQWPQSPVFSVAFSPDGQTIVSGSFDQTIRLWSLDGSSIGEPLREHPGFIWFMAFSPDGQTIVSGSSDSTICLWSLNGRPIGELLQGHQGSVRAVAFSPDGRTIVSGSVDKTIRLWSLDGTPIGEPMQGHQGSILSVAFSPDGQTIVSGSDDNTIRLWRLDGTPIGEPMQGHQLWVMSVAFSPDGRMIVSGSFDQTIRLWSLDGTPIGEPMQGHQGSILSVAFSPDGQTIVSGSDDNTICLWRLAGTPIRQPMQGHQGSILSVAFSPDGQTIVSGSVDQTIRLWSLDGTPIGEPMQGHQRPVVSVAFSSDGQTIVSGSEDMTTRLWRGNWQTWLKVCSLRLGYHLISEDPELELLVDDPGAILRSDDPTITSTQKACATCQKYAWSDEAGRKDLAKLLRRQGHDLARLGKPELAERRFRQAEEYEAG